MHILTFVTSLIVFTSVSNGYDRILPNDALDVSLPGNTARIVTVPALGSVILHAAGVTEDVSFIVCQAHAQLVNIILSTKPTLYHDTSVRGRDIGMVTVEGPWIWYLYSNSSEDAQVLVHLTYLTGNDPLPGGCNQEFNLENDPNIHLDVQDTKTRVEFQWSNTGYIYNAPVFPQCEDTTYQSYLRYQGYVHYIQGGDFQQDTYFDKLKLMLMADDIVKHGTWLREISSTASQKSFLDISSYRHQGVIYAVVVQINNEKDRIHTQAAYIPVVTYACENDDMNKCKQKDIAGIIFATLGGVLGLFLCFFGHRFFKMENFIFGFILLALIFYQVFSLETDINLLAILVLSALFGLIGGILLLGLWWYKGIPVLNVIFISLVAGYIMSSVLFYTPFANLTYWDSPFNYGATFACGVLIGPVFMLFFTRFLSIFSCALLGSYGIIVALDTYLDGGMRYIILNSLRHGKDKDYVKVIITGPFTATEISLTVVWLLLVAAGISFQIFRERKKAPFPPCPRSQQNRAMDLRRFLRTGTNSSSEREPLIRGGLQNTSTEREPLIRGDNQRQYNTSVERQPLYRGDNESQYNTSTWREPLIRRDNQRHYESSGNEIVTENMEENSAITRPKMV